MRSRLAAAAVAPLVLAASAAPAGAATVSQVTADSCAGDVACSKYGAGTPVPVTSFSAAPGEANRVTVTREGATFLFREEGAPLQASAPCVSVDPRTARCPVTMGQPGIPGLALSLGDGDDSAAVAGDPVVETLLEGGEGADTLAGGGENDRIDGGPGDDRLQGGEGFDELVYALRTRSVTVDLGQGTGGEAGERDLLSGFETLVGGAGADRLRGGAGEETIDGGEGDDAVDGGRGNDALFGGLGADRLRGGPDDDRLFGDPAQGDDYYTPRVRHRADRLDGGRGDDVLHDPGGRNVYLGGPGRDVLEGGAGRDRMHAGTGDDRVNASGGSRDAVNCGPGRDRARTDLRRDTRRGCERR